MFCTSLRKQSEWAPIIPSLISSTSPKFQERTLSTHDIAFPIQPPTFTDNQNNQTNNLRLTYLYFLLLTPTSLHESNRAQTLARIDRLSILTGTTKDVGIIFLLSDPDSQKPTKSTRPPISTATATPSAEGTHAFMELQLQIHTLSIPTLPLPSPTHLLTTLHHYTSTLSSPAPQPPHIIPPKPFTLTHLLPTTTATYPPYPLPTHATNVLSDIVPSLRALVDVVVVEGERELGEYLGNEVVDGMVEFWEGRVGC